MLNQDFICGTVAVKSIKYNQRIVSQNGLFLICGLNEDKQLKMLQNFRIRLNDKTMIYLIEPKCKNNILRELDILSINRSTLFPEIENKTRYIKEKYGKII